VAAPKGQDAFFLGDGGHTVPDAAVLARARVRDGFQLQLQANLDHIKGAHHRAGDAAGHAAGKAAGEPLWYPAAWTEPGTVGHRPCGLSSPHLISGLALCRCHRMLAAAALPSLFGNVSEDWAFSRKLFRRSFVSP
jgi:hypothetical protein